LAVIILFLYFADGLPWCPVVFEYFGILNVFG
jgi:hypothetical protein